MSRSSASGSNGLGDRAHGPREVGVDERQARLAVVGLDLLEHVVDLLERAERREADARHLLAQLVVGPGAQHLLGARDDDLQRRAQVVGELAEQPLAVVVHAREPLGERGQLRVLLGEALLDPLAVGDRPALGDDERDPAVPAAQRPQQRSSVPLARPPASISRSTSKRENRPSARRRDRALERAQVARLRAGPPGRAHSGRPMTSARSTPPAISACGLTSSTWPSASSSAMKLDDFACATFAINWRATASSWGSRTWAIRARSASTTSRELRQ